MRTWERTRIIQPCGHCGVRLSAGTPVQVITLPALSQYARRRIRCEKCADAPIDIEQIEAFDVAESGRERSRDSMPVPYEFTRVTKNLFDAKAAAMPRGDD